MGIDHWCLRSGEEAHCASPENFWLPSRADRDHLVHGQAVKLLFDQEGYEESGEITVQCERMWVIVTERVSGRYLGVLDNDPQLLEPNESTYLRRGVEVAFDPEHVIDVGSPPADYVAERLGERQPRRWA
jgi:hypothetical protein